jgi:DNA-binding CsgD family transcriptional regulator
MGPGSLHPSGILYKALPGFGIGEPPILTPELIEDLGIEKHTEPGEKGGGFDQRLQDPLPGDGRLGKWDIARASSRADEPLFDAVRKWCYPRQKPADINEWIERVVREAHQLAGRLQDCSGVSHRQVEDMGKRVAEWSWKVDREVQNRERAAAGSTKVMKEKPPNISDTHDSTVQAYRQVLSAEARRAVNSQRDSRILELREDGLSYRQIAAQVGIGYNAVQNVVRRGGAIAATSEEMANVFRKDR